MQTLPPASLLLFSFAAGSDYRCDEVVHVVVQIWGLQRNVVLKEKLGGGMRIEEDVVKVKVKVDGECDV